MVSVGQVPPPCLRSGQLGAIASEHVGEHRDRLSRVRGAGPALRRGGGQEALAFPADAFVPVQFGGGPGAGCRVGGPGRGGEDERQVGVGAAGHRRVEPLPVLVPGDDRDPGVHGGALGGMPGDRVGQVAGPVAGVAERLRGKPPLPGRRVRLEQAADHDATAGDGLDSQDVPVGQAPSRLARLYLVVVAAADDQIPGRGLGAFRDPDCPAVADQAEVDQVVADPGGQFPAPGPVRGHQQHVPPGQIAGHIGLHGLVHGLLRRGTANPAALIVFIQRGRRTFHLPGLPRRSPRRRTPLPSSPSGTNAPQPTRPTEVPRLLRQAQHSNAAGQAGSYRMKAPPRLS